MKVADATGAAHTTDVIAKIITVPLRKTHILYGFGCGNKDRADEARFHRLVGWQRLVGAVGKTKLHSNVQTKGQVCHLRTLLLFALLYFHRYQQFAIA